MRALLFTGLLVAAAWPAAAAAQWSGHIGVESRLFPASPLDERQRQHGASIVLQPEWDHRWDRGRQFVRAEGFVRLDAHDGERTHLDLRELTYTRVWDAVELTVGLGKVYWGVAESQHLVDVVNQTDLIEDVDGEDKLGQPMARVSFIGSWGTLDAFVLPGFRERTFPGGRGRLRPSVPIADHATYESGEERRHVDWAVRLFRTVGAWDIGVSHFAGTSRDPRLVLDADANGDRVLVPHYELIHQTGLDVQWITGGWLWKFEGIVRAAPVETHRAFTAGFEYTLVGVLGTAVDVGVLLEYLYDDRREASTAFDDDVFVGTRIALNDVQSTDVLAGAIIDRTTGSTLIALEANRRIGDRWTVAGEVRAFVWVPAEDPLYGWRRDSHLRLTVERHF